MRNSFTSPIAATLTAKPGERIHGVVISPVDGRYRH